MSDFNYWYNNVADIPMRDENGNWYDCESNCEYFSDWLLREPEQSKKEIIHEDFREKYKLRKLAGSRKQKLWAEDVRMSLVEKMNSNVRKFLGKNLTKCSQWIDLRFETTKSLECAVFKLIELQNRYDTLVKHGEKINNGRNFAPIAVKEFDKIQKEKHSVLNKLKLANNYKFKL